MKIYRVYHPFHESSESGTIEFGYFSTLEKAKEVLKQTIEFMKKDGYWKDDDVEWDKDGLGYYLKGMQYESGAYIQEFELDEEMQKETIGYT